MFAKGGSLERVEIQRFSWYLESVSIVCHLLPLRTRQEMLPLVVLPGY